MDLGNFYDFIDDFEDWLDYEVSLQRVSRKERSAITRLFKSYEKDLEEQEQQKG